MEKKRKKSLPRIGIEQINNARKILVHAAKNDKVIDYDQYSQDFVEACGVNVETPDEAKKYFFKTLSKSVGGIYQARGASSKLDSNQLKIGQKMIAENQPYSEIAEAVGLSEVCWDDFFVGFDPEKSSVNKKKRKRYSNNKTIAEKIEATDHLSEAILEMKETGKKIKEITGWINEQIEDGIEGIDQSHTVNNTFTTYFIHTYKGFPKRSRNKYKTEELSDEVRDYISLKYGREGISAAKIKNKLNAKFGIEIPYHGLMKIIKDLHLTKGKVMFTPEQIQWLEKHAPEVAAQENICDDFNKKFETNYEEDSFIKIGELVPEIA